MSLSSHQVIVSWKERSSSDMPVNLILIFSLRSLWWTDLDLNFLNFIQLWYYGQRLPILVLWLQKLLVSYCYWYWYCRFAEDGSEIDVGIAKDKSLLLVLILLLFSEAIKYWYWYWYCTPEAKSIDIDIELKFLLSHTPDLDILLLLFFGLPFGGWKLQYSC